MYPDQIQPEGIERPVEPGTLEDRPLVGHKFALCSTVEPFADRMSFSTDCRGGSLWAPWMRHGGIRLLPKPQRCICRDYRCSFGQGLARYLFHQLGVVTNPETSVIGNVSARGKGPCQPNAARWVPKTFFSISGGGQNAKVQRQYPVARLPCRGCQKDAATPEWREKQSSFTTSTPSNR